MDPNGFFRNPNAAPAVAAARGDRTGQEVVVVKVQNVSARPELNDRLGIVAAYQEDRGRYLVRLVPIDASSAAAASSAPAAASSMLSLKPENVILASWFERLKAQYQLFRYDPQVHLEVRNIYQQCAQQVAPLSLPAVVATVLLVWLVSCYWFGFTTTLFWSSLLTMGGLYVVPQLLMSTNRGNLRTIFLERIPNVVQQQLEQHVPMLRGRLNKSRTIGLIITVSVLVIAPAGLWGWRSATNARSTKVPPLPWDSKTATTQSRRTADTTSTTTKLSVEEYYKLGFDDAKDGLPYGTSLPSKSESRVLNDADPLEDPLLAPLPGGKQNAKGSSTANMLSTAVSAWFVGRTVWDLGRDRMSGANAMNWSWQRAQQAAATLPVWQMAILGISVYRLVAALGAMI